MTRRPIPTRQSTKRGKPRQAAETATPSAMLDWCRRHPLVVFAAVSFIWVALLYGRALEGPFVYDDTLAIQDNSNLASWRGLAKYFHTAVPLNEEYRGYAGSFYRPVYWASLFLDRSLWGLNPVGFHLTNLLLHWANGLLGFLLLRKLGVRLSLAAATCLIWLGLPISSEAVAWISGRPASLVVFFFLLGTLAALRYVEHRKAWWLGAAVAALGGALLSNEWAIVALPLTLFAVYLHTKRIDSCWLTLAGAGAVVAALYLAARNAAGAHLPTGTPAVFAIGVSLFKYIVWMTLPVGMSVERSSDTPATAASLVSVAALAAVVGLVVAVYLIRKRWPDVAAGLAWMLIAIAPFCGLVFLYQGMAERYTYLASAGLVYTLVAIAFRLPRRRQPFAASLLVLWVIWGAWRLNARVSDWGAETRLFQSSLTTTPRSAVLLYNLGVGAAESGDLDSASSYYHHALAANPKYASAMTNLGSILHRQGKYTEAEALLRQAIAFAPKSPEPWVDLGNIYLQQGSLTQAKQAYQKALAIDPDNLAAITNFGAVFQAEGDFKSAEQQYRHAIALNPQRAASYCDLGALLLREGDTLAALDAFNQAIAADPRYPAAYFDLGVLYEQTGHRELAIDMYAKALELQPEYPKARARLNSLKAGG